MNYTLEQKVGQMLNVGWQSNDPTEIIENIKRYNFGNVILFTRNTQDINQLKDTCARIQETAIKYNGRPCFISIDQEGGSVRRIYGSVTTVPGSMAIAAASAKYPKSAYQIGKIVGEELKQIGVNMNLAPVADINTNAHNPVIAIRSFGDDPVVVSRLCGEYSKGLQESGVMACYKHFLGHGDVDVDSHLDLPRLNKTLEEIELCELVPYKTNLVADSVMSAHVLYNAIDDRFPASISSLILRDILRKKMKYKGLIVSDCFEMDGLASRFSLEEAGVFAVKASTDIITISHRVGRQLSVRNGILQAVKDGVIATETIDHANDRISQYKKIYCNTINPPTPDRERNVITSTKVSQSSTAIISGEPFDIDSDTVVIGVTNYVNSIAEDTNVERMDVAKMIGEKFNIPSKSIDNKNFNLSETLAFANNKKVVLCLADSHLTLVQKVLYTTLMQSNARIILVSMRTPYDVINQELPECHIGTFEYTTLACESLLKVLEEKTAIGVCPVKLNKNLRGEGGDNRNHLVENSIEYMKANYSKKLTLDSVAEEFGITGGHLCKLLKKSIDKNFIDLLNEIRIGEAKKLLVTTTLKIYEISTLCGYQDFNYFAKIFKKYLGVTPTYYRNNSQANDII